MIERTVNRLRGLTQAVVRSLRAPLLARDIHHGVLEKGEIVLPPTGEPVDLAALAKKLPHHVNVTLGGIQLQIEKQLRSEIPIRYLVESAKDIKWWYIKGLDHSSATKLNGITVIDEDSGQSSVLHRVTDREGAQYTLDRWFHFRGPNLGTYLPLPING